MAKKKNRDLVEEQGIGYIKVTAKVKKGAVDALTDALLMQHYTAGGEIDPTLN